MSFYSKIKTKDLEKLPILQGEENEYGEYDYYVNEKPENTTGVKVRHADCESCGRRNCTCYESISYFYTYDGWDYVSYRECADCYGVSLKTKLKKKLRELNKRMKRRAEVKRLIYKTPSQLTRKQKKEAYIRFMKIEEDI